MTDKDKPTPSEKPVSKPTNDGKIQSNESYKNIPPETDSDEE